MAYGVDPDAVRGELECGGPGEGDQGACAGAVGGVAGCADHAEDRRGVHAGTATVLTHEGCDGLDAEQRARRVDGERGVPLVNALLEQGVDCIVDQHIQSSGCRAGMVDDLRPVILGCDIEDRASSPTLRSDASAPCPSTAVGGAIWEETGRTHLHPTAPAAGQRLPTTPHRPAQSPLLQVSAPPVATLTR